MFTFSFCALIWLRSANRTINEYCIVLYCTLNLYSYYTSWIEKFENWRKLHREYNKTRRHIQDGGYREHAKLSCNNTELNLRNNLYSLKPNEISHKRPQTGQAFAELVRTESAFYVVNTTFKSRVGLTDTAMYAGRSQVCVSEVSELGMPDFQSRNTEHFSLAC